MDLRSPDRQRQDSSAAIRPSNGFAAFVHELRRRRVCRALTTYCVAFWLVCQVVEILSPQLGLPDWTLRFVIIQGIIGFPIALVASWLFEVTPNGLLLDRRDGTQPAASREDTARGRLDRAIDCGLLAVALVIGLQMAVAAAGGERHSVPAPVQRIAVMQFPVSAPAHPDRLAAALLVELQHELARRQSFTVLAPGDVSRLIRGGSSLTGAVVVGEDQVRVTAIMIDNDSGEVIWSELLQIPYSDGATLPATVARRVVEALVIRIDPSSFGARVPLRDAAQLPPESNIVTTS
jgi:TolB-like protein